MRCDSVQVIFFTELEANDGYTNSLLYDNFLAMFLFVNLMLTDQLFFLVFFILLSLIIYFSTYFVSRGNSHLYIFHHYIDF